MSRTRGQDALDSLLSSSLAARLQRLAPDARDAHDLEVSAGRPGHHHYCVIAATGRRGDEALKDRVSAQLLEVAVKPVLEDVDVAGSAPA